MNKKTRDLIFITAVVAVALIFALVLRMQKGSAPEQKTGPTAFVQVDGTEILRVPLSEDAKYIVADGEVRAIADDVTLEALGEEASASKHDINIIRIRDGSIFCEESNCENRVCVHTAPITGEAYDTPIVCLPHGMFVYLVQEEDS